MLQSIFEILLSLYFLLSAWWQYRENKLMRLFEQFLSKALREIDELNFNNNKLDQQITSIRTLIKWIIEEISTK